MTAIRSIRLECDCGCAHLSTHDCEVQFPGGPIDASAGQIREQAAAKGWEVLRHTKGRDLCPPCRIAEIRVAAGIAGKGVAQPL